MPQQVGSRRPDRIAAASGSDSQPTELAGAGQHLLQSKVGIPLLLVCLFRCLCVTILGFQIHGTHLFSVLIPKGAPLALAPLLSYRSSVVLRVAYRTRVTLSGQLSVCSFGSCWLQEIRQNMPSRYPALAGRLTIPAVSTVAACSFGQVINSLQASCDTLMLLAAWTLCSHA